MSGTAPAADVTGNIYLILGNGTFDTSLDPSGFPLQGDCGNCYAKISSTSPHRLLNYFTPVNTVAASAADEDFGSGGPWLLFPPDPASPKGSFTEQILIRAKQ